jgi:2-oxoisovalerate dehydrogenase E1 component beta subunit
MRYRSGGQFACPLVIRAPYGGGIKGGHYHSQSPEAYFAHTPGLKVVVPSNPCDAKGLLIAAIRDADPVVFLEPKRVYRAVRGDVPPGDYTVEVGSARIVSSGRTVTVLSYGAMLHTVLEAVERLEHEDGVSAEVIDLRTLIPYDIDTILGSVRKTGRAVVVHEAPRTCGFGAELSAAITERALLHLEAPVIRVAGYDTPFPYALENHYLPSVERVLKALRQSVSF